MDKVVYLGYECYYDYCEVWRNVTKVFDCEVKALIWEEDFTATETAWREYAEFKVEP